MMTATPMAFEMQFAESRLFLTRTYDISDMIIPPAHFARPTPRELGNHLFSNPMNIEVSLGRLECIF